MAVNETVIAITRTPPTATRPLNGTGTGVSTTASAPTPVPAPAAGMEGIGSVFSWSTEVALNLPTSGRNRSGVRADAVLRAPEVGVPALLVEVDNCTETADTVAAKFDKYLRFFRLKTRDHQEHDVPTWRLLYPPTGREGRPPVAVVFNPGTRLGPQALKNRMNTVMNATRAIWSGSYEQMSGGYGTTEEQDGYYEYADAISMLFTTLDRLQAHGPRAEVWWRCGHNQWETLDTALANPHDHEAWRVREEERRRRHYERRERQQEAAARDQEAAAAALVQLPAARDPQLPEPEPCERCGRPRIEPPGVEPSFAPPEDGCHCDTCRLDISREYPGLFSVLFKRGR